MPPMPHKSTFEPKDPRIISLYDDYEDEDEYDDWSLTASSDATPRPRRKKTSTQALVEFLNTTSPEEFQKNTPKRSSNLFFRRRKKNSNNSPNSSSISNSNSSSLLSFQSRPPVPNTIMRKNYIEILPNPHMPRDTSIARITSLTPSVASASKHSLALKSNQPSGDQAPQSPQSPQHSQPPQEPILPSNRSLKKRESSLYSESLRHSISTRGHTNSNYASLRGHSLTRQDTEVSLASKFGGPNYAVPRRLSEHTFGGLAIPPTSPADTEGFDTIRSTKSIKQYEELERRANELAAMHLSPDMDAIEAGLLQRLERFRLSKLEKPSDMVADKLALEHIRALQASTVEQQQLVLLATQDSLPRKNKVRHVLVQTLPTPLYPAHASEATDAPQDASSQTPVPKTCERCERHNGDQQAVIAELERQLAEEQRERKRLQAVLDDTRDHFEVLSGLAYKKLRELWEDRAHWENACIELRDRLMEVTQMPPTFPIADGAVKYENSEYATEEPDDK